MNKSKLTNYIQCILEQYIDNQNSILLSIQLEYDVADWKDGQRIVLKWDGKPYPCAKLIPYVFKAFDVESAIVPTLDDLCIDIESERERMEAEYIQDVKDTERMLNNRR